MKTLFANARLAFLLTALSGIAVAEEEIAGAFGMELGEQVSESDSRITEVEDSSRDAGLKLAFEPDHPFGALDQYHVLITPKTRKIYRVTAVGSFESASACEGELAVLQEALEERYGATDENVGDTIVSSMSGVDVIRFGSPPQRIVGTCIGSMGEHRVTLSYIHDEIEKRAKAERAQIGGGDYEGEGL